MAAIDYYFSTLSPFTYLAGMRLEEMAGRHGASINYKPCDMAHVFGETGGLPPAKRHPSRQEYRLQELKRLSGFAGMLLNLQPKFWPVDPMPSLLAVIGLDMKGGDTGRVAHGFLRACWAEERDISDPATVSDVLAANGVEAESLTETVNAAEQKLAQNTEDALAAGVFGAPFYVVNGERFWGHDRLDFLDRYLAG